MKCNTSRYRGLQPAAVPRYSTFLYELGYRSFHPSSLDPSCLVIDLLSSSVDSAAQGETRAPSCCSNASQLLWPLAWQSELPPTRSTARTGRSPRRSENCRRRMFSTRGRWTIGPGHGKSVTDYQGQRFCQCGLDSDSQTSIKDAVCFPRCELPRPLTEHARRLTSFLQLKSQVRKIREAPNI